MAVEDKLDELPGCSLGKFTLRNATPSISIFLKVIMERDGACMRRHSKQECVSWRKTNFGVDHGFAMMGGYFTPRRREISYQILPDLSATSSCNQ